MCEVELFSINADLALLRSRIYFCEDLQTSYWEVHGGDPSNSGKKKTTMVSGISLPFYVIKTWDDLTMNRKLMQSFMSRA